MENLILSSQKYIDLYYLIVFMAVTYSMKNTVQAALQYFFKTRINKHFAVFFIGSVVALPFWLYFKHDTMILLVTYTVGTSIHDLIIRYLLDFVKRVLPKPSSSSNLKG